MSQIPDPLKPRKIDMTAIEAELKPKSNEELHDLFIEYYGRAAVAIAYAAICVKLMEQRGVDLKGTPMLGVFRRIAAGQLMAELVWTYIESPGRQIIERCAMPDQARLVEDPYIPVLEPTADGKGFTPRRVDMRTARVELVKQAIGPDGIRSDDQQIVYLRTQKPRPAEAPAGANDQESIGERLEHQISFKMTATEFKDLRILAAKAGCSEARMARRLYLSGLKQAKS